MEALAKLKVQSLILNKTYDYVWSDILEFENKDNPHIERKNRISKWKQIASSIVSNCDYFLTTDKGILRKATQILDIKILNPIDFVSEMEV